MEKASVRRTFHCEQFKKWTRSGTITKIKQLENYTHVRTERVEETGLVTQQQKMLILFMKSGLNLKFPTFSANLIPWEVDNVLTSVKQTEQKSY